MNALVTGAGGFLGLYIVERLVARGDHVRGLCRGSYSALDQLGVEVVRADVRDRDAVVSACAGIDVVFHAASMAGIWGSWRDFYEINVLGTEHVIEGCVRQGVGRLVYTSSPSVTFDGTDQCGIDESAPYATRWLAHYPHSKALAEQCVLAANGTGGLLTCSLRPHLIWGPRDNHLVPRLIERARAGKLRRVGDGQNRIDMVYVENAAAAHLQAAEALADIELRSRRAGRALPEQAEEAFPSTPLVGRQGKPCPPPTGRAYFISQGDPVNCWQWINQLLALAGLPPISRSISASAAWKVGACLETAYRLLGIRSEPRMTRFLAAQLSTSHYFNLSAARRDFGYIPRISTEEGMRRLAASWASSG